jgi:hypothetical protein
MVCCEYGSCDPYVYHKVRATFVIQPLFLNDKFAHVFSNHFRAFVRKIGDETVWLTKRVSKN